MLSRTKRPRPADRRLFRSIVLAVLPALALHAPGRADVESYVFEQIADTSGEIAQFGFGARLNDSGEICFRVTLDNGEQAVYRASGSIATPLAASPADFYGVGVPDINNAGKIVYQMLLNGGGTGIQYAVGPLKKTLYDTDQLVYGIDSFDEAMVNSAGRVAFLASSVLVQSLYFSDDAGPLKVLDVSGPLKSIDLQDFHDGDQALILAELDAGGYELLVVEPGGATRKIADTSGPIDQMGFVRMNGAGVAIFTAVLDTGYFAIMAGDGGPLETIADSSGPFAALFMPLIDDEGRTAFFGELDSGETGIYFGPNSASDALIASDTVLDGVTIENVTYLCDMNARGQVVFTCDMADGRSCMILASPDRDNDGTPDYRDECPDDPVRIWPGLCGCGAEEFDTDGDGLPDACEPVDENAGGAGNGGANAGGTTPQTTPNGDCCGGGMPAVMPLLLAGMRRRRPARRKA